MSSTSMPPMAAAPAAIVTPTIDEFEQASFYAADHGGDDCGGGGGDYQISLHQEQHSGLPSLPRLESIIDTTLPSTSFYSPATDAAAASLESYIGTDRDAFQSIASLASVAVAAAADVPPSSACNNNNDAADDVMEAAGILCHFKKRATTCMDCSPQDVSEIVDMAVEMLSDEMEHNGDDDAAADASDEQPAWDEPPQEYAAYIAPPAAANIAVESLVHPDRLAAEDDHEEVNKLHQYVRKDLLEIFVVPQAEADDDSDDDENEEDEEEDTTTSSTRNKKASASDDAAATVSTRRLVTRRRSIPIVASAVISNNSTANRHYPGRVGLRCVHCANIRRKSTSKAAFYPLRLKNIYREVCAWQRIHFKKCPHVPSGVRERYDHYKRIDTSRGKVRYWETSAKRIGLQNNPARDDGVVFAQTAWRA